MLTPDEPEQVTARLAGIERRLNEITEQLNELRKLLADVATVDRRAFIDDEP